MFNSVPDKAALSKREEFVLEAVSKLRIKSKECMHPFFLMIISKRFFFFSFLQGLLKNRELNRNTLFGIKRYE